MAETQIDSLVIEIGAKSSNAASDIDMVTAALTRLKSVGSFTKAVNNLTKLGTALEKISVSSAGIQALYKVSSAIENLSTTSKGNSISNVVNSLKKIPDVVSQLDDATINKFATAVNKVSTAITPLTNKITALSTGFSRLPGRLSSCVTAANRYQRSMQSASAVSGGFFGKLKNFLGIGGLFSLTFATVGRKIGDSITEMNSYIENVNLFTVSMGKYADEAMDYAEKVQDAMGIDMSEFIRNQGIFMNMASGFGVAEDKAYKLSKGLTELAYDISSFYNVDVDTAFQRLQSGIAGEIEPVRRWGIALDQASMQEWMLKNNIDAKVNSLNQADKAMVRYNMMVEAMAGNGAIGDFARTLITPANAIRILQQQITQLSRAIGSLFIPILITVIPYVQAFVKVLTSAIRTLASFFGFQMPEIDYSGLDNLSAGASGASDSLDNAAKSAKKLKKYIAGFDELNIIPNNSSSSSGGVSAGISGLDLDPMSVWDEGMIDGINNKVEALTGKMKVLLGIALTIGAAFLVWKIGTGIVSGIKAISTGLLAIKTALYGFPAIAGQLAPSLAPVTGLLAKIGAHAAPIAAVAGAITLITLAVLDLWKNSEPFREAFGTVWDNIKTAVSDAKQTIEDSINGVLKALGLPEVKLEELYGTYIRPIMEKIGIIFIDVFGNLITGAIKTFAGIFETVTGIVVGLFTGDWSQALDGLGKIWDGLFSALPTPVQNALKSVGEKLSTWWGNVKTWFDQKVKPKFTKKYWIDLGAGLINGFKQTFNNLKRLFAEQINKLISKLNAFADFTIPGLKIAGKQLWEAKHITLFKIPKIQAFAKGGVLEDGLFTMNYGEIAGNFGNGKSVVANNMQIIKGINSGVSSGIRQAIGGDLRNIAKSLSTTSYIDYSSMDANPSVGNIGDSTRLEDFVNKMMVQNNQSGDYTFVVNLDGEVVAKKVFKVHNKIAIQTGETPLLI